MVKDAGSTVALREKVLSQLIPSQHPDSAQDSERVTVDYIKGTQFRTIHPDGAISALNAQGRIEIAFFCERRAIPNRVVHKLNEDGSLGDILEVQTRGSVIRDIDTVVALQPDIALDLARFIMSQFQEQKKDKSKKISSKRKLKTRQEP
ncbi:MAG: hypothetical protein ACRYHQ_28315 [Janthinobacterium lividum]